MSPPVRKPNPERSNISMAAATTQPGWGAPQTVMQRFKSRFTRGRVHKGRGGEETTTPQATYKIPRDPDLKPGDEGYIVPGSRGPGLKPSFKDTQSKEEGGTGFGSWTGRKQRGKPGGLLSRMRSSWNQMTQANLAAIDRERAERGLPMRKQVEMDPEKPYNIFGSPRKAPRRTMKTTTPPEQRDRPDHYVNLLKTLREPSIVGPPKEGEATPEELGKQWKASEWSPIDQGGKPKKKQIASQMPSKKRRDAVRAAIKAKKPEFEADIEATRKARAERKETFRNISK